MRSTLEKLIKNETRLEISSKEKSIFEEFQDYYIERQFKRFIQIDRKILNKNEENDQKKNFVIVHTEKDFEEKCLEWPKTQKSIHYLKRENDNQNLVWQKSKGSISDLNEFLLKENKSCLSIHEDQIFNQNEDILIISADPGMGKSTILEKLIHDLKADEFFIKIVLNDFTKELNKIKRLITVN